MLKLFDIPETPINTKNEWYTPSQYIEAAREVMGSIDLDPASCELANGTVKATRYYTQEDNGLAQEWYGNVWLNPPYGRTYNQSNIELFTLKLVQEYEQEKVKQAILLATCRTDSAWFIPLWQYLICFASHQVRFYRPSYQDPTHHTHGTLFVYLGNNEAKFIDVFSQFGTIAKRVN